MPMTRSATKYSYMAQIAIEKLFEERVIHLNDNPGIAIHDGKIFLHKNDGVEIFYPDGIKRFIKNSWYDNKDG
jgi:hypothetical protein